MTAPVTVTHTVPETTSTAATATTTATTTATASLDQEIRVLVFIADCGNHRVQCYELDSGLY